MNKTKIEWVKNPDGTQGYTINPIKGICKNDCPYCYAKRMYKRFKWDENIRPDFLVFHDVVKLKKPSKIFIGSTHDIFGKWMPYHLIAGIIEHCKICPEHTFIFLTKNPSRYKEFIFPENCWLGTSIESNDKLGRIYDLTKSINRKNKLFVSFEPLLSEMQDMRYYRPELKKLNWVIIGGLTPKLVHEDKWVLDLMEYIRLLNYSEQINIPIFLKDNLKFGVEIKEFPAQ